MNSDECAGDLWCNNEYICAELDDVPQDQVGDYCTTDDDCEGEHWYCTDIANVITQMDEKRCAFVPWEVPEEGKSVGEGCNEDSECADGLVC